MKEHEPYLTRLQTLNLIPNFWVSEEYFEKADIKVYGIDIADRTYLVPLQDNHIMFPPLSSGPAYLGFGFFDRIAGMSKDVWASFPKFPKNNCSFGYHIEEFLDFNFIYDPKNFLTMEGKDWQTFRKNVRKWPRNNQVGGYREVRTGCKVIEAMIRELLIGWLESMGEDTKIHDDEVLFKYAFEGQNRKGLFNNMGELVGLNIWDENYMFINYRFCICRNEPFLSEYMRYRFYTDPDIIAKGKLINDGGSLDRYELERFKRKLNPVKVYDIFSWKWVRN